MTDRCISALVPQAAIDAAVLAASKPVHDDGHTDCFYAGILLAAWPHLNAQVDGLRAENERLRRENASLRRQMSAADVPCGCKQTCGDDGDIDGPGTCKDLPMKREPPVELTTISRRASDDGGAP